MPNANVLKMRITYVAVIGIVIFLGLGSRQYRHILPPFLGEYTGDVLYATMAYFGARFLFPLLPFVRVSMGSLLFCYLIEVTQLYHSPWIDEIRHTRLGGLILGNTFSWSDIVSYTIGVLLGLVVDANLLVPAQKRSPSTDVFHDPQKK